MPYACIVHYLGFQGAYGGNDASKASKAIPSMRHENHSPGRCQLSPPFTGAVPGGCLRGGVMPKKVPSYRPKWAGQSKRETDAAYARTRDKDRKSFYDKPAWKRLQRAFLAQNPNCAECWRHGQLVPAVHVHHTRGMGADLELAFDQDYLESLCKSCHSRIHMREVNERKRGESASR